MAWADRFSNLSIAFYEAIRSPRARDAATQGTDGVDLSRLHGARYALVVTFRRSGEPVPTPVWFGIDDGHLYFRSVATGAKLKRLAREPRVLVAPCTANGRPTGPSMPGRASLLTTPADEATAETAIRRNYGLGRRAYIRMIGRRVAGTYVKIAPTLPERSPGRTASPAVA